MTERINTISDAVQSIQEDATTVLELIQVAVPDVASEAKLTEATLLLIAGLVTKALKVWAAVAELEITPEAITALLPNPAPLTAPAELEVQRG